MDRASNQTLRFAENLSLPKVQVVVMRGSTGSRIAALVTRMNDGWLDYEVNLHGREVVVRGYVDVGRETSASGPVVDNRLKKKPWDIFGSFRPILCFRGVQ